MITNAPWLARVGDLLRQHARTIRLIQWLVVGFYLVLLLVPAFLSLPPSEARMLDSITVFAQFLFWGLWWPFVLLSMVLFGRLWCGVLCPEGSLSEWISWRGLNRRTPQWIRWSGWPTIAFVLTTVYGQLISVYDYGRAAAPNVSGADICARSAACSACSPAWRRCITRSTKNAGRPTKGRDWPRPTAPR